MLCKVQHYSYVSPYSVKVICCFKVPSYISNDHLTSLNLNIHHLFAFLIFSICKTCSLSNKSNNFHFVSCLCLSWTNIHCQSRKFVTIEITSFKTITWNGMITLIFCKCCLSEDMYCLGRWWGANGDMCVLFSEQEIFREEITSLQTVKGRLQLRITALEEELKKTKEEIEKKAQATAGDEEVSFLYRQNCGINNFKLI